MPPAAARQGRGDPSPRASDRAAGVRASVPTWAAPVARPCWAGPAESSNHLSCPTPMPVKANRLRSRAGLPFRAPAAQGAVTGARRPRCAALHEQCRQAWGPCGAVNETPAGRRSLAVSELQAGRALRRAPAQRFVLHEGLRLQPLPQQAVAASPATSCCGLSRNKLLRPPEHDRVGTGPTRMAARVPEKLVTQRGGGDVRA